MKNIKSLLFIFTIIVFQSYSQTTKQVSGWENLKYSLYFTSSDVEKLLLDSISFLRTTEYFKPVKVSKVYLEIPNDGSMDINLLNKISNKYISMNIKVAGAMKPAIADKPICYNNLEHLGALEKTARTLAKSFDEFLVDGYLFTDCSCEKCLAWRGKSSWANYRTKLVAEKSKKHIIDAAKLVKPSVRVVIKYPNWYETYEQFGYDVVKQTNQFDGVVCGIETRSLTSSEQHIPPYSGYILQNWLSQINSKKWVGSCVDNLDMKGKKNEFVAQIWQAVIANAPEIILYSAGSLYSSNPNSDVYSVFIDMLPEFDKVAGLLQGNARGVPIYLPYGSDGEYNIFGYLGMIGIPLKPVSEFPTSGQAAIFTEHSLRDPNLVNKMLKRLKEGKDIFMTWTLWLQIQDTEFRNALYIVENYGSVAGSEFRVRRDISQQIVKSEKPISFEAVKTQNMPSIRAASIVRDDYDYAVFMQIPYLKGTIYILNIPENAVDIVRLPSQVLNVVRNTFINDLDVQLAGSGGVCMYLIGDKQYVIYNMNNYWVSTSLRFEKSVPTSGWKEVLHRKQIEINVDASKVPIGKSAVTSIHLALDPFEIAIIQAP